MGDSPLKRNDKRDATRKSQVRHDVLPGRGALHSCGCSSALRSIDLRPRGVEAAAASDPGAEVIRIEDPRNGRDMSRKVGWQSGEHLPGMAQSHFFPGLNRNK